MRSAIPVSAPASSWEQRRLAELASLDLLDTPPEPWFDHLTALVAEILDVPIALVSIVDAERQWFKSRVGVGVQETAREVSFCIHAIAEPDGLVIPDARLDPRFASNPHVAGPDGIRAYAAAVLRGPGGLPVGTLCVVDTKPRAFDTRQLSALRRVADLVELEIARRVEDAAANHRRLADAFTDPVTGLPTERIAMENLDHWLAAARPGCRLAARVHLDRFTEAVSIWGQSAVRLAMCEIAARLAIAVGPDGVVARGTGGMFTVLSDEMASAEAAHAMVTALIAVTRQGVTDPEIGPFLLGGARVGAALAPDHGTNAYDVFARAALSQGMYQPSTAVRISEDYRLEVRLRRAIESRSLFLEYQPKFDLASGRVHGAEALCRWRDPELGFVSPARFVPVAERAGLVNALGWLVVDLACEQVGAWLADGVDPGRIAVNISPTHLLTPGFADAFAAILARHGLPGERFEIELTEGAFAGDLAATASVMCLLRDLGVEFAIDDFGTGYSSLSYLAGLPVTALKVDRAFVTTLEDRSKVTLARVIIQMAHALGMVAIAEGVETPGQAAVLLEEGCDMVQGYLYSRPVAASAFAERLRAEPQLSN